MLIIVQNPVNSPTKCLSFIIDELRRGWWKVRDWPNSHHTDAEYSPRKIHSAVVWSHDASVTHEILDLRRKQHWSFPFANGVSSWREGRGTSMERNDTFSMLPSQSLRTQSSAYLLKPHRVRHRIVILCRLSQKQAHWKQCDLLLSKHLLHFHLLCVI